MSEKVEKLADRLVFEAQKCVEYLRSLPLKSWTVKIYTDGSQWDVRELLAHFVSAEAANTLLVKNILSGGAGAPLDFDIDAFNNVDVQKYYHSSIEELLERYIILRQSTVAMVQQMTSNDLNKVGRHPFLGQAKVEDIIKLIYLHNQIHLRDVKKALSQVSED